MSSKVTWKQVKGPVTAVVAVISAVVVMVLATQAGLVETEPGTVVIMTLFLVNMGTSDAFYINAVFRFIGTILGIVMGSVIGYLTNLLVEEDIHTNYIWIFRMGSLAVVLFVLLMVNVLYPRYIPMTNIFLITSISLIFAGVSNSETTKQIVSLVGSAVVAAIVLWLFRVDSAEELLLNDNNLLVEKVFEMVILATKPSPKSHETYVKIFDDTKDAFTSNRDTIMNYNRWMKWTCQVPHYDFESLTTGLRPMYIQGAAAYSSMAPTSHALEKFAVKNTNEDEWIMFCSSPLVYRELYEGLVDELVASIDRMSRLLREQIFSSSSAKWHFFHKSKPQPGADTSTELMVVMLHRDILNGFVNNAIELQTRFIANRDTTHPTAEDKWHASIYMFGVMQCLYHMLQYLMCVATLFTKNEDLLEDIADLMIFVKENANATFALATDGNAPPKQFLSSIKFRTSIDGIPERHVRPMEKIVEEKLEDNEKEPSEEVTGDSV
jgi:hypothetical protein